MAAVILSILLLIPLVALPPCRIALARFDFGDFSVSVSMGSERKVVGDSGVVMAVLAGATVVAVGVACWAGPLSWSKKSGGRTLLSCKVV